MARIILALGLDLLVLFFFFSASYSQNIAPPAQDPMAGSRVFGAKGCSNCHSVNGVGGKVGPDLARVGRNRSFNDIGAAMWNHLPQMAAEAKKRRLSIPELSPTEAGDLIAFLFTQNYFDGSGNPASGKKLFTGKSCILCHQIAGVGGVLGPNLDAVGQTAAPINLAAAMWNHAAAMADSMRTRGIERPTLSASELRDLIAYLRAAARHGGGAPVSMVPGRINDGRALFEKKQCIKCHNIQGSGGNIGPDLGKRGLHRDFVEFAAALWNKAPAMLREMRLRKVAVPSLTPEEMADIIAYLRSFQYFGTAGNPARGRQILADKQCLVCHSEGGELAKRAPDFARIKGLDSPAAVISAMWSHGGAMAQRAQEQKMAWPQLTADDMTHLMAFFERSTRSER